MEQIFSSEFWGVAATLSSLTVIVAGAINGKCNVTGAWQQVIAWVVALAATAGAWQLGLIGIAPEAWGNALCLGVAVGLSANGIYDIPFMKQLVSLLFKGTKGESD